MYSIIAKMPKRSLFSLGIQHFFLFKINRKSNKNQLIHQILFYLKYLRDRFKYFLSKITNSNDKRKSNYFSFALFITSLHVQCMSQVSFYTQEHNKECQKYPMNCESCGKKKIQRDKVAIIVYVYI